MYMYPAYIHEDDDGTASGFFPVSLAVTSQEIRLKNA